MTATSRGVDVSAYQGKQDWAAHKKDGVVFAFAKASEGQTTHDSGFAGHIKSIKAAGLVPGGYHFAWPNQDVTKEAANYVAAVKPYAGKGFTHWLDLERYTDGRNYAGRTAAQIKAYATAWIAAVQKAFPGQRVGVYTSSDDLAQGHVPAGVPLWFPAYTWGYTSVAYATAEAHAQPKPSGRVPMIWQFTSTPMDRSICYMTAAQLRDWAAGDDTPEENDVALTADDINKIVDALEKRLFDKDGVFPAPTDAADYDPKPGTPGNGWSGVTWFRDVDARIRKMPEAVWAYKIANPARPDADGKPTDTPASSFQRSEDSHYDALAERLTAIEAAIAALAPAPKP